MIDYYQYDLLYTGFVAFIHYLFWAAVLAAAVIATVWVLYALFMIYKQVTSTFLEDDDDGY